MIAKRPSTTKNGTPVIPISIGPGLIGANRVAVGVAGQHRLDLVGVEAGRHGERRQLFGEADRDALFEVAGEQPFLHRVLDAALPREVQQAMGVEGPARPGPVQVVVEALGPSEVGDALVLRRGLLHGDPVLARDALRRTIRRAPAGAFGLSS